MFELTRDELSRCNFSTLNKGRGSNVKYLPFAFTELGVAMLSSVLNSKTAIGKTMAELQAKKKESEKPRNPIGFVIPQHPKKED